MMKTVRKNYRRDVSFGMMVIIFAVVYFLAGQLFEKHQPHLNGLISLNLGKALVGVAVIIMILILWEDILFPVHIKPVAEGLLFRNHSTKLITQSVIYLIIPMIIFFLYLMYNVNAFRFSCWAGVCALMPVIGKLRSGIRNYNDFLLLTDSTILYKNNQLEGAFTLSQISKIRLIKDEGNVLHKVILIGASEDTVTIDLDEMELEDYYHSINEYIVEHYTPLLIKE